MTDEELKAIEERANAATEGPWEQKWDGTIGRPPLLMVCREGIGTRRLPITPADADFIAHARLDVPALLAEVKRLRELAKDLAMAYSPFVPNSDRDAAMARLAKKRSIKG